MIEDRSTETTLRSETKIRVLATNRIIPGYYSGALNINVDVLEKMKILPKNKGKTNKETTQIPGIFTISRLTSNHSISTRNSTKASPQKSR